jgi:uncharacterized protein (DUF305 family)
MAFFSRASFRKRVILLATTTSVAATSFALAQDPTRTHHVGGARIQDAEDRPGQSEERPFLSENAAAMKKMMADMTIKPSGDVDRDFVEMMVPHHQGAVDMAQAELAYGHNAQLRQLARQIIETQQREIVVMRRAIGDKLPPSASFQSRRGASAGSQEGAMPHSTVAPDAMSNRLMDMK